MTQARLWELGGDGVRADGDLGELEERSALTEAELLCPEVVAGPAGGRSAPQW